MKHLHQFENIFAGRTTNILLSNVETCKEIIKELDPDDEHEFKFIGDLPRFQSKRYKLPVLDEKFLLHRDPKQARNMQYKFLIELPTDSQMVLYIISDVPKHQTLTKIIYREVPTAEAAAYLLSQDIDSFLQKFDEAEKLIKKTMYTYEELYSTPSYGRSEVEFDKFKIRKSVN